MKMLDLFCGAGGATKGYQQAGFHVTGVDMLPGKRYVGDAYIQGDVMDCLDPDFLSEFDFVHASPPCQAFSDLQKQNKRNYVDLVAPVREALLFADVPYIIENVEGAPLWDPIMLCGAMFPELRVYRHRLFESSIVLTAPAHPKHVALTFTHDKRKAHYGQPMTPDMFVQVTGGGNAPVADKKRAMGIDWMNGKEVNQAIPPAYSKFLGEQVIKHLES